MARSRDALWQIYIFRVPYYQRKVLMLIILSIPLALLCFFLGFLCYKRVYYKHALVLTLLGFLLLCFAISMIVAGYYVNQMIRQETVSVESRKPPFSEEIEIYS
jgi:multisubunit Na+/H+ antiporter MnhF subunit